MDDSPEQAFRLNIAGGQFANHRASPNIGFSNWLGDVFAHGATDQFKHTAPDRFGTALKRSRRELNQPTVIGKRHAASNGEPEHFHDAGDDAQRVAMRKSAGRWNHAERVGAE